MAFLFSSAAAALAAFFASASPLAAALAAAAAAAASSLALSWATRTARSMGGTKAHRVLSELSSTRTPMEGSVRSRSLSQRGPVSVAAPPRAAALTSSRKSTRACVTATSRPPPPALPSSSPSASAVGERPNTVSIFVTNAATRRAEGTATLAPRSTTRVLKADTRSNTASSAVRVSKFVARAVWTAFWAVERAAKSSTSGAWNPVGFLSHELSRTDS
mmetsp:Transcript_53558/g.125949  ORF Transcript_53558/g.125949 Transcript_53558/m.125949 type:complete len:218 (-) Transcript_53558:453-1106(-)